MKVKSYYLTKKSIVCKDYDNKTIILDLNRMNLMEVINSLDSQIDYKVEDVIKEEDKEYLKLINILGLFTFIQVIFMYVAFLGFTKASYLCLIIAIVSSLLLILASFTFTIISVIKIRSYKNKYRFYEGKQILLNKYNSLSEIESTNLVDA